MYRYNVLTNKCEHLARWCKTGRKRSVQSQSFVRSMAHRVYALFGSSVVSGTKWLFFTPQGQAALKYGANIASAAVAADASKVAAQEVAANEVTPPVASTWHDEPSLLVSREIQMVCKDIRGALQQYLDDGITGGEFIEITVKRMAEGCASVAGAGVALAIPILRNPIGCTLAKLIGQGVGAMVSRHLVAGT